MKIIFRHLMDYRIVGLMDYCKINPTIQKSINPSSFGMTVKKLLLSFLILGTTCMPVLFGADFDDTVKKIEEALAGRKYDVVDKQSQEILKQSTDDAQKVRIHALLGDSFEKQRKFLEALKSYTAAMELAKTPDTKKTYSLKVAELILKTSDYVRYPEMIRILSEARDSAAKPEDKINLTMRLAEAKLNGQYLEDAVALLRELIKAPETPTADRFSAQIMIGDFHSSPALRRSGNLRQSLKEYQSALQMPGLSVEQQFKARKSIASTYSKCNEYRPAIEACLEAAKLSSLPVDLQLDAYTTAAGWCLEIRDIPAALQAYRECGEIPGLPVKDKAAMLAKTADTLLLPLHYDDGPSAENAQKAIKIYESIIELTKDNYNPTKRIAEIQYQQRNYQAALKTLEKLLGPKCGEDILILCGNCEAAMNNIPKARTYYEQAFALPSLPHKRNEAAQHLVKILISLEEYAKAVAVLEEVKKTYPPEHKQQKELDIQLKQLKPLLKPSPEARASPDKAK